MSRADSAVQFSTSTAVLDAYIERSWRSNAERQRKRGLDFVIGKRGGPYLWNLEGDHCVIDCGVAGGVHSLGHHNVEIANTLRAALDEGRDTGLWAIPNAEYLRLQDKLADLAPTPELKCSLVTLASTVSVDMAASFAFRYTGRQRLLAYRHGYHGHSGFAAMVTGSLDEGVIDYYNMPSEYSGFMPAYGDTAVLEEAITEEYAALILEPMDYETFAPAPPGFLEAVQAECRRKGVLFIIDETRTGLGRTGRLWASEFFDIAPDMLITGKGLSGGLYPTSALMTTNDIYEICMNQHKFSYISSLGGNEISCIIGRKVLEIASRPGLLERVQRIAHRLEQRLREVAEGHEDLVRPGTFFGAIATLQIVDTQSAGDVYKAFFDHGVLAHSISVIEPTVIKLFPCLTIDEPVVDEIADRVDRALQSLY